MRHKIRLVIHGFSQMHRYDYQNTYSLVMYGVFFSFSMDMPCMKSLETCVMDVVTT